MDLNRLLSHHQQALITGRSSRSAEGRRWSQQCAEFYAGQIAQVRSALGRDDPFTYGGLVHCG